MKIAVFGGSFNPPHRMHYFIVLEALAAHDLHQVIVVPTGDFYPKADLMPCRDRCEMLRILFAAQANVFVSSEECHKGETVYTWQTLDYWQKRYPQAEIYFLCGSDNLRDLPNWRRWRYLLESYSFLVVPRDEDDFNALLQQFADYKEHIIEAKVRQEALSSTQIREKIRQGDWQALEGLLAPDVAAFIKEYGLYQSASFKDQ